MVAGRQGSGHEDSRQGRGGDRWRQRHRCSHGAPVCSRWSAWRRRSRSRWGEGPRSRGRGRPRGLPRPGDALRRERRGSGAHADRGGLGAVRTGGSVLLERWRGVREGRRRRLRGVGPGVAGQRAGARVRSAGGAAVDAGARSGLPVAHLLGGGAPDQPRRCAVHGEQSRCGRVRGVARGHLRRQGSANQRPLSTRGEDQYAARGPAGGERGGAGGGRRRRAAGARAGRRRRGRGTRRRALPDPAALRGSDLPTAQGGGPGPLAGRHAPPGRRRLGPGRGLGRGSGRGGGLRPWLLGPRGGPVSGQPAPGAGGRWGVTLPLDGVALPAHRELVEELPALGYADVWSAEVSGADAFTPLALAAAWSPALRLGTAIAPAATRGPALLAMSAAAMAEAAPGRFALGIGASSQTIVEQWNAASFEQPFRRTRDTLRFVRRALAGERIDEAFDTFTVRGFRLTRVPEVPPPLLLAAREADGAITNLLAAGDVPKVAAELHSRGKGKELVARLFVCPTEDLDHVRKVGRRLLSTYLNVPVYAEFHRWLGRGAVLAPMWSAWAAGDLRAASAAVPDEVVDELLVHGTPERCRAHLERYVAAGITTPVLALLPTLESAAPGQALAASERALRSLAPAARA